MSDGKIWSFQGKLIENDKRVITNAEGSLSEIDINESPSLNVASDNGKLVIDLKIPTYKKILRDVGKQFLVDEEDKNIVGQSYGEIFNDYTNNTAKGIYSHVTGYNNKGQYPYQIVFGKYNKNNKNNVLELGYGEDEYNRKNIFEIDQKGNVKSAGDIVNGNGISLNALAVDKADIDDLGRLIGDSQPKIIKYSNDSELTISNNEITIATMKFLTTNLTTPLFWATIPFTLNSSATVTFRYYLDNILQTDDTLQQQFDSGIHFATLFNIFEAGEDYNGVLKVTMTVSSGTASIEPFTIKSALYVQGVGITSAWNGKINVTQLLKKASINKRISMLGFSDKIYFDGVVAIYIFETLKKIMYEYDERFIAADESFHLLTHSSHTGEEFSSVETGIVNIMDVFTWAPAVSVNYYLDNDFPTVAPTAIKGLSIDNKDKHFFNKEFIEDDYKFKLKTVYSDYNNNEYVNYKQGSSYRYGSLSSIDLSLIEYRRIDDIIIKATEKDRYEISSDAIVVFSFDNKDNYEYNSELFLKNNMFQIKLDYQYNTEVLYNGDDGYIVSLPINLKPYQQIFKINNIKFIERVE